MGIEKKVKNWRKSTKILGTIVAFAIIMTVAHFLVIYPHLTQLILVLGFSGMVLLYLSVLLHEWIRNKMDDDKERDSAIDQIKIWATHEFDKVNNKDKK